MQISMNKLAMGEQPTFASAVDELAAAVADNVEQVGLFHADPVCEGHSLGHGSIDGAPDHVETEHHARAVPGTPYRQGDGDNYYIT